MHESLCGSITPPSFRLGAADPRVSKPVPELVSLTVTEKVYGIRDAAGALFPEAGRDFEAGPARPESYMGRIAALLHWRFLAGAAPVSLVSMDNLSHNGDRLSNARIAFAKACCGPIG